MSTSSTQSRGINRRTNLSQAERRSSQYGLLRSSHRHVAQNDAYTYALRVAYLSYLLQPRARRLQHVAAPQPQIQRASTSVNDLMKDFTLVRDSKSTRFPHGFMSELEKRLTGVLMGKERRPEYGDAVVKRTFAVFYTAFTEQSFRKRMEKDRRVEDLVLIFFSSATKELAKGKAATDDAWKLMVDRHVALFVRLISSTLKDHDWVRDRPELTSRLATLESKLLKHDQDLAAASQRTGGAGGMTIEVEIPLTHEVKDIPLAQVVARMFGLTNTQVQSDISKNKPSWTEKAALTDLKNYQNLINVNSPKTIRRDDFDLEDAYESWRKAEGRDLSQLMLAIMQSNPELAKSTPGGNLPQFMPGASGAGGSDSGPTEPLRKHSGHSESESSYVIDQPVDLSALNLNVDGFEDPNDGDVDFTFVPPDPRGYYRYIVAQALTHDLKDQGLQPSEANETTPAIKLLSKQSTELLNEVALRWRIPHSSRMILFLDVIKEKFIDQEIDLDTLDEAFSFLKAPLAVTRKSASSQPVPSFYDRSKWTKADIALNRQILSSLDDALLRDLYDLMQQCYGSKPPSIGPAMHVLENHVHDDPLFFKSPEAIERFSEQLRGGLKQKASDVFADLVHANIPTTADQWEFYNVIQLGKAVVKLAERIQKRYRKNPEILGVNPLMTLVETIFPLFGSDAGYFVGQILERMGDDIGIEEGFELYKELAEIRRVQTDALPEVPFAFNIEDQLARFVQRWIEMTDRNILDWVDGAIRHDKFNVRTNFPDQVPSDDERHSESIIDIFRSFNQSVDQIVQLNWDNDVQYAKFMTSLAKTICTGIARYCEIVEQKFAKEMDRLSPEQEIASNQTRQGKWVQLARDTWNNKEKIEPFQFFPESFVKLNNVEWAVYQLDKLQNSVNVDACAEVIRKSLPATSQRQRKITKYVFTIKIVEAEDLKACDVNGLSDPYVVLGDEYQKRLAKTRIIYGSLNPRWEETVDITTTGPLNIIATIWDWDTLGDHDCVGRTSIKLDPSHFSDFMPREYWLDLDTQGRLLLRVNMEGERDDIIFYYGKAFRALKRTERDMTRIITDKVTK
ncbi:MAG: hypothetical protein M1837_000579 [Sclerophora amabilis]|nr:MAG: hypothetical protein M1837_000579 [Sclerophora amabilis]